jgi:hypothetical protein
MAERVGTDVIGILEEAGERLLEPKLHRCLLLHIGGAPSLRRYVASEVYWDRVQAILDSFFDSAERAEICSRLIEGPELRARPEFRGFLARALAERRLQDLIVAAKLNRTATIR